MGNQRLEPISEIEDPPDPPEGFSPWSEYSNPGGRWLPKAAKAGTFTATTVVSGFLFAFALGAVPGLDLISFDAVTPATALIAGLVVLVLLVGVHEGIHGVVGYFMGADVSFTSGRYGSFRTLSRHAIQGRRETRHGQHAARRWGRDRGDGSMSWIVIAKKDFQDALRSRMLIGLHGRSKAKIPHSERMVICSLE